MLGVKLIDAQSLGRAPQFVERRIALAQRHHIAKAVQDGQQLAEAPDAGVIDLLGGAAPLPPEPLQRARVGPVQPLALAPAGVNHLKELSTLDATEVRLGFRSRDHRPTSNTPQLMQIVVHGYRIGYQFDARFGAPRIRLNRRVPHICRVLCGGCGEPHTNIRRVPPVPRCWGPGRP